MSNRAELVSHWQSQLAVAESSLESDAPRLRWLWRMRTRLYRFLLSCYGEGAWEPEDSSQADLASRPSAVLLDNTADLTGLHPKSAARIRATLKSVRNANDREVKVGPYVRGLGKDDWIRVAAFRDGTDPAGLVTRLELSGLPVRKRFVGREVAVEVQRADFDAAILLFKQLAPERAYPA